LSTNDFDDGGVVDDILNRAVSDVPTFQFIEHTAVPTVVLADDTDQPTTTAVVDDTDQPTNVDISPTTGGSDNVITSVGTELGCSVCFCSCNCCCCSRCRSY
jgi:hypothetical protein